MVKEDDITQQIIQNEINRELTDNVSYNLEAEYNNYGSRGFADLHLIYESYGNTVQKIIEVKRRLNNANEILRQFEKMRNNFFEDNRNVAKYSDKKKFRLYIYPDEKNFEHLKEYFDLYKGKFDDRQSEIFFQDEKRGRVLFTTKKTFDYAQKLIRQFSPYHSMKLDGAV